MIRFIAWYLLIGASITWILDWSVEQREKQKPEAERGEPWNWRHHTMSVLLWPVFLTIFIGWGFGKFLTRIFNGGK